MPMLRGSPVRSTSTTSCLMNLLKTEEACFKAYLRCLSTIRKCVTIWQGDYCGYLRASRHRYIKARNDENKKINYVQFYAQSTLF